MGVTMERRHDSRGHFPSRYLFPVNGNKSPTNSWRAAAAGSPPAAKSSVLQSRRTCTGCVRYNTLHSPAASTTQILQSVVRRRQ